MSYIMRIFCYYLCLANLVSYSKAVGCQSCVNNRYSFSPFLTSLVTLFYTNFRRLLSSQHTYLIFVMDTTDLLVEKFLSCGESGMKTSKAWKKVWKIEEMLAPLKIANIKYASLLFHVLFCIWEMLFRVHFQIIGDNCVWFLNISVILSESAATVLI